MTVAVVAPSVEGITDSEGTKIEVAEKIDGGPSVLFDAVAIVLADEHSDEMAAHPGVKDFVSDAHAHQKFVAYTSPSAGVRARGRERRGCTWVSPARRHSQERGRLHRVVSPGPSLGSRGSDRHPNGSGREPHHEPSTGRGEAPSSSPFDWESSCRAVIVCSPRRSTLGHVRDRPPRRLARIRHRTGAAPLAGRIGRAAAVVITALLTFVVIVGLAALLWRDLSGQSERLAELGLTPVDGLRSGSFPARVADAVGAGTASTPSSAGSRPRSSRGGSRSRRRYPGSPAARRGDSRGVLPIERGFDDRPVWSLAGPRRPAKRAQPVLRTSRFVPDGLVRCSLSLPPRRRREHVGCRRARSSEYPARWCWDVGGAWSIVPTVGIVIGLVPAPLLLAALVAPGGRSDHVGRRGVLGVASHVARVSCCRRPVWPFPHPCGSCRSAWAPRSQVRVECSCWWWESRSRWPG